MITSNSQSQVNLPNIVNTSIITIDNDKNAYNSPRLINNDGKTLKTEADASSVHSLSKN